MAFQKAVKGTILAGGGALAAVLGLSQFAYYRRKQMSLVYAEAADCISEPVHREPPSRDAQLLTLRRKRKWLCTRCRHQRTKNSLVERDDYLPGTSSRSTNLIHGGVRYLQKAMMKLDIEQYRMVTEALDERANLPEISPHLSAPLPIMLPVYKWWQLPYYWVGIKLYDLVAGSNCLKSSYVLSKSRALEHFPMLQKDKLVGGIVYYDGRHNDAWMNLAIVLTAARYGDATVNDREIVSLLKKTDTQTDSESACECQVCYQCCWTFHRLLTSDGRVIFFLPWQKMMIAGTTDTPTDITHHPSPSEEDINFILNEARNYLSSAWSGIRPLVTDPKSADTHERSLITTADTLNAAIKTHNLKAGPSRTAGLFLQGDKDWNPTLYMKLVQDYGLESEGAQHLAATCGDKAFEVATMASVTSKRWPIVGVRLVSEFPYIEAEVNYGIKEYSCTTVDMISRCTRLPRLAFLNVRAAEQALLRIVELMDDYKKQEQLETTRNLLPSDSDRYKKRFCKSDADQKGFITIVDVPCVLESINVQMDENTLHEILNEVDLNKNGQVELNEFLQLMSAIQKGRVSGSRLFILMKTAEENLDRRVPIPVDHSYRRDRA
uniref:Glycerol-3-phosphate dehydrogenase, mitochondrial n=1 Tax=Pan troglodytes TaxID=9598 RepID=A0A2I3TIA9_PANTR